MSSPHPRSTRLDDFRQRQRAAVVDAVIELVSEGTSTITVADLAARAAMSRPTFYKYFPTLGSAMLETHRTVLGLIGEFVDSRESNESSGRERLLRRFDLTFESVHHHPELMLFFSYFDFTFRRFGFTPEEHERLMEVSRAVAQPTLELFIEGQADGSIAAHLPVEVTFASLATSVLGLLQRLLIQDEASTGLDERAREMHDALIEAWRKALSA